VWQNSRQQATEQFKTKKSQKNHQIETLHHRKGVPQRLMEHSESTEIPNSRGKQTTVT